MSIGPRLSDDGQWWWTGTEWVRASQAPASPLAPKPTSAEVPSGEDGQWRWTGTDWVRWTAPPAPTDSMSTPPLAPNPIGSIPPPKTESVIDSISTSATTTAPNFAVARTPEGERVLYQTRERLGMWWWIAFVMIIGLVTLPWWAARTTTVTSQRVIKRAGLIWRQSQAIPLMKIADVNTVIGPLAASVFLTSAGGPSMIIGPLTKDSARKFAAALEAAREGTSPA